MSVPTLSPAIRPADIVRYYDTLEPDYRYMWNLGRNVAMHFGYWDAATRSLPEALERENAVLAELARVRRGDRVLDAGCGIGGSAIYLAREHDCRVTGVTLSAKQVRTARRLARRAGVAERTEFLCRDFQQTGFPDAAFDVVWAIESVCHAPDKAALSREFHRVLAPGGRLVVADGFAAREHFAPADRALMDRWLRGWCVEALATADGFSRALAAAGFGQIRFRDATPNVLPSSRRLYRWSRPLLGLAGVLRWCGPTWRTRALNLVAAHGQYLALTRGLWQYGLIVAHKPNFR
jgi:cyclopropane fatty-acyl-phospholipid synthase-like methyltransferase